MKTISINDTDYEIELDHDILLMVPDHTLVFKSGWDTLKIMYGDSAIDNLDTYMHRYAPSAERIEHPYESEMNINLTNN